MPKEKALERADAAFQANKMLCERCKLGFREYWSVLAMMHEQQLPEAGKAIAGYAFAPTPAMVDRVPMCRSSLPICEGMLGVLKIKFGERGAQEIGQVIQPMVLQ